MSMWEEIKRSFWPGRSFGHEEAVFRYLQLLTDRIDKDIDQVCKKIGALEIKIFVLEKQLSDRRSKRNHGDSEGEGGPRNAGGH